MSWPLPIRRRLYDHDVEHGKLHLVDVIPDEDPVGFGILDQDFCVFLRHLKNHINICHQNHPTLHPQALMCQQARVSGPPYLHSPQGLLFSPVSVLLEELFEGISQSLSADRAKRVDILAYRPLLTECTDLSEHNSVPALNDHHIDYDNLNFIDIASNKEPLRLDVLDQKLGVFLGHLENYVYILPHISPHFSYGSSGC